MRHVSMLCLLAVSSTTLAGSGGGFPQALTHPVKQVLRKAEPWKWPPPDAFEKAFDVAPARGLDHDYRVDWAYSAGLLGRSARKELTWEQLQASPEYSWDAPQMKSAIEAAIARRDHGELIRLMPFMKSGLVAPAGLRANATHVYGIKRGTPNGANSFAPMTGEIWRYPR